MDLFIFFIDNKPHNQFFLFNKFFHLQKKNKKYFLTRIIVLKIILFILNLFFNNEY